MNCSCQNVHAGSAIVFSGFGVSLELLRMFYDTDQNCGFDIVHLMYICTILPKGLQYLLICVHRII